MTRASNLQRVNRERIHTMYIHRNTSVENITAVDPVSPVAPVENRPDFSQANYLLYSDQFYSSLGLLTDEYKKFYHDEQMLEKALSGLESETQLFERMKDLVEKYNQAAKSLKSFDQAYHLNYYESLPGLLSKFSENLDKIGITIPRECYLQIDRNRFHEGIRNVTDPLQFLFEPLKGFIVCLYRFFRNIKLPPSAASNGYDKNLFHGLTGTIIDKKS